MVEIAVEDTGEGIAAEDLPRLFDPSPQPGNARGLGSLGLGLALVRRIVELHGGSVEAESPGPGLGARFSVWLPREEDAEADATEAPEPAPRVASRLDGVAVLLVEDCAVAREVLSRALAASGARAWFGRSPRRLGMVGGAGGLAMIGLGIGVAVTGRKD